MKATIRHEYIYDGKHCVEYIPITVNDLYEACEQVVNMNITLAGYFKLIEVK